MKRLLAVSLATVVAIALACEPPTPTIDGSSEDSVQASITEVRKDLPEDKREAFDRALITVAMNEMDFEAMMSGQQDPEAFDSTMRRKLDGKSAADVFDMAEEIRQDETAEQIERSPEQIEQVKKELSHLEEEKKRSEQAEQMLRQFEIKRSKLSKQEEELFSFQDHFIELEVVNNTDIPVSRAYFEGTYITPGRSIPWAQDEFNYEIPGGLEPGESAQWRLTPGLISDWSSVELRNDAVFTVETIRLEGPGGEPVYEATFDEDDAERLEALKQMVEELSARETSPASSPR